MITTAVPTKPLDTFTLELPKGDTAFLKTIVWKRGWTLRSNRRKMQAYERSLDDERNEWYLSEMTQRMGKVSPAAHRNGGRCNLHLSLFQLMEVRHVDFKRASSESLSFSKLQYLRNEVS